MSPATESNPSPEAKPSCRFYGISALALHLVGTSIPTGGNECGGHWEWSVPCKMEVLHKVPDETICPIAKGCIDRGLEVQP